MSVKLSLQTLTAKAAALSVRLVDHCRSLAQRTAWTCDAQRHSFELSYNSLLRRHKAGQGACPVCARDADSTARRAREFEAIRQIAVRNGLSLVSEAADYKNQSSRLAVRCDRCATCTAAPILAHKLKAGHVCSVLARSRQAASRRLPFAQVQQVITANPHGLELLSSQDDYQNNLSPLRVRCASGHEFVGCVSDLGRTRRPRGCPFCALPTGQATTIALTARLLERTPQIEYSPPFLRRASPNASAPLRFDAWFPGVVLDGESWCVALEYHGAQHKDPGHHFHQSSRLGAVAAFERLKEYEQIKRDACAGAMKTALLEIEAPDPEAGLDTLFARVCAELQRRVPGLEAESSKSKMNETARLTRFFA